MAVVTANGVAVLEGSNTRPRTGVWTADLKLDQPDGTGFDPGTQVTIASENGYSLVGVVDPNRTGDFLDSVHVRVLGGAGGMSKASSARSYVQPGAFVRDILGGLMQDSGETLAASCDAGILGTNVTAWSVMGGYTVAWNLTALLRIVAPTASWRHLPDGTLWIGFEAWPTVDGGGADTLTEDPKDGSFVLGVEAPFVAPGTNISGIGNVSRCVDIIESHTLRTHVYVDLPSEGGRGGAAAIGRIVRQALAGIDYYALYICQVVTQSADLTTVDVQPVGARNTGLLGAHGLQRVPVRAGSAVKMQFVPGATVLLGWDGGSPSSPFVIAGLSGDGVTKIQLAGTHPAPLFDVFYSDLVAYVGVLNTLLGTLVPTTGATGTAAYASAIALPTSFLVKMALPANYQSQIVSNG